MSLTEAPPEAASVGGGGWPSSLEERLAEVVGLVNVCVAELVALVGEALRTGAWEGAGIRSPEHWVAWRCGVSPSRARRLVGLARAMARLPETAAVFAEGRLGEDQAAVIARHAGPEHDGQVAELAPSLTVPQLRRVLAGLPRGEDNAETPGTTAGDGGGDPPTPTVPRSVAMGHRDDGSFWCSIRLPAEEGALVERALTEARTAVFRLRHPDAADDGADPPVELAGVTWADSLVHLAHTALGALDPATRAGRPPGERTQVLVHLDADRPTPPRLHLGPVLPAATADLLTCDATVRAVLWRDGVPVARGRRRRTVDPGLRTLVEHRDGGCRVPGCDQRRWLHVHHVVHWRHGGPTDPDNLVALCSAHHRMVHTGELRLAGDPSRPDGLRFHGRDGRPLVPAPPHPPPRGTPPGDAARAAGLPDPAWSPPPGEPLDTRWVSWDRP